MAGPVGNFKLPFRKFVMTPVFPAAQIPEQAAAARLLGLYPQIQEDLWLQRVKILGGILTAEQWRALARIVRQFTPVTPLHLTTRQDIEIHDLSADIVPLVQQEMAKVELTGLGACGDTVRNLTVCPCSGVRRGVPDLMPLAWQIRRLLEDQEGVYSLPRKFKISLSACPKGCGQPYINDLGLVAAQRDGAWGVRVIAGGSLGPRPATGVEVFDWLPANDVLPLALGAFRVFAEHGDRSNRHKARLRHVRERVGNETFISMLRQALERARLDQMWPQVKLVEGTRGCNAKVVLNFPNGNICAEAAEALAKLANQPDTHVKISNHHQVAVFGADETSLARCIASQSTLRRAAEPQPHIVACPGKRWCKHALTDTAVMAERIRQELGAALSPETTVCISGCPNGCAQSGVAAIGLVGMLTTENQVQREAYNLLLGGGMGRNPDLARLVAQRASIDDIIRRIAIEAATISRRK